MRRKLTRHLKLDYPRDTTDHHMMVKSKIPLLVIKDLKSKASSFIGENVSFSVVFAAIQSVLLFSSSQKKQISIGIVMAVNGGNRFNNFTAVAIEITRPSSEVLFDEQTIVRMTEEIHKKAMQQSYMVQLFYSMTNIYNVRFSVNRSIDVLISGTPFCSKTQHTIDGIEVTNIFATMPYHTCPIYICHGSDTRYCYLTQHFRTNDIDLESVKSKNAILSKAFEPDLLHKTDKTDKTDWFRDPIGWLKKGYGDLQGTGGSL